MTDPAGRRSRWLPGGIIADLVVSTPPPAARPGNISEILLNHLTKPD